MSVESIHNLRACRLDKLLAGGRARLSDPHDMFKTSLRKDTKMEDAFLDSYWESLNDVQEPYDHNCDWHAEMILAQWD